ncbi:MAG: lipid-A-disaccharide synthase [Rickettsiales bacterium]
MKIALIAGETSGDQLGGWLMEALKRQRADLEYVGLGGPNMQAQGLTSIFPMHDVAFIGIAEILPHARNLMRRIKQTVAFLEAENPDIIISIDVPGFALRVLKQLHANGKIRPKLVHYVAPTVWAYRPKRANIVAERYDHILCLLPFEPPYFTAVGMDATYIGHEIAWWWKSRGDGLMFRARHNIAPDAPLLALFPGSRKGELQRLLPVFGEAIAMLKSEIPTLEVVAQLPQHLICRVAEQTRHWPLKLHLLPSHQEKKDVFAAATAALAKSGTIGLECALAGLPSVTAYKANPLSVWLLRRMITTKFVNLANVLLGRELIPELLQENCTAEKLVAQLKPLLTLESVRDAQRRELNNVAAMLGVNDTQSPSEKAAEVILTLLAKS